MVSADAAQANDEGYLRDWLLTLLTASCPSTMPVSGLENQSLNCAWLAKTCAPEACHVYAMRHLKSCELGIVNIVGSNMPLPPQIVKVTEQTRII